MSAGVKGRAKGGLARAESLDPDRRVEIAKEAAAARWGAPKATHAGELHIGEISIQCAVLPDGRRMLSQRSVGRALGKSFGGAQWKKADDSGADQLPFFLAPKNLGPFISNDLLPLISKPVPYQHNKGGGVAHGIEATALPMICDVWLRAREAGALTDSQLGTAQSAEILMRGLAHVGIVALVDEATGYQEVRDRTALQKILDKYLTAEKAAWAKTFPDDFYKKLFRLRRWPYDPGSMRRPGVVGGYTNNFVYDRLAPGVLAKIKELNPSNENGNRKAKHHQFFTADYGVPELKTHITNVMFLMDAAGENWELFKQLLDRAAPRQGETMPLFDPEINPQLGGTKR